MSDHSKEALKRFAQAALALQEAWAKESDGALDNGYPFAKDFADIVLEIQKWSESATCEYCHTPLVCLGAHGMGCPKCAEAEELRDFRAGKFSVYGPYGRFIARCSENQAVELLLENATRFAIDDDDCDVQLGLCPGCGACLTETGGYCGECVESVEDAP